ALRAFVVLAEELHVGRTALRLDLSQPQVSRRIRLLEGELGVQLFVRTPRRTAMTGAGARLLADARATLAAADLLRSRAQALIGHPAGRVSVGFVWSTLGAYLPPLVAAARERHAEIELAVSQRLFVEIVPALRRGDVDLVISRSLPTSAEMVQLTVRYEPSLIALPVAHPLAARSQLTLSDLVDQPLIGLARTAAPAIYDGVIALARERGLDPAIVRDARSPSEALALVGAGVGLYRIPATAAPEIPEVCYRELTDAPSRLVLVRRPEPPSPGVAAIAELIFGLFGDASNASHDGPSELVTAAAGT
ncbi:MAG: LysR family transcriptional regulator, partial [Solirubrobacteraceae bacterium]